MVLWIHSVTSEGGAVDTLSDERGPDLLEYSKTIPKTTPKSLVLQPDLWDYSKTIPGLFQDYSRVGLKTIKQIRKSAAHLCRMYART